MSKTKKRIISITAIIIVIGLLILLSYLRSVNNYQTEVSNITISDIDIKDIPDGTYTGEYDVNFIYAKVDVTIQDGSITKIDLVEHKNERGEAAEVITDKMIDEQNIDVDTVSSATNSSKVIMKAVENALDN